MPGAVGAAQVDLADGQQGMDEGGDEQTDGQLAGPVAQQALHDAGRDRAHRELDHHEDDGQDERREADHRRRHRLEDRQHRVRGPDDVGLTSSSSLARSRDGAQRDHYPITMQTTQTTGISHRPEVAPIHILYQRALTPASLAAQTASSIQVPADL